MIVEINAASNAHGNAARNCPHVDGVMLGRAAYHNPFILAAWTSYFSVKNIPSPNLPEIVEAMIP